MISEMAKEETYADVQKMLFQICWKDVKCCDFEERLSAAHLAYSRAYNKYDPSKGAFTTYVHWAVTNELRSQCQACRRNARKHAYDTEAVEAAAVSREGNESFSAAVLRIVSELSDDARVVASLVLDAPAEVVQLWAKSSDPKATLRIVLASRGWSMSRATEAFSELGEALGGRPCA